MREYVVNMVPRARIGEGSDIGKTAVFVASDDSNFVTGVESFVDGGVSAVQQTGAGVLLCRSVIPGKGVPVHLR